MKLRGIAELPLHYGRMPRWLYVEMVKLAEEICKIIVFEYGKRDLLNKLSNPFWFQALGCVLGFDWHSSGLTTTVTAALRDAFKKAEIQLFVAGGKGKVSKKTPQHIRNYCQAINIPEWKIERLIDKSKIIAKIDNAVLQDSYDLYHHAFIFDESGRYCVVQQGMNTFSKYARRYHWIYETIEEKGFFNDSHSGIITAFKLPKVIDIGSTKSKEARAKILDLAKEPMTVKKEYAKLILNNYQCTLHEWLKIPYSEISEAIKERQARREIKKLVMQSEHELFTLPKKVDWKALREAYERQPKKFEDLLKIKGIGKANLRALALISALIYGEEPSWKDPASYSFAHGGKDGIPYPVSKAKMEKSIQVLQEAIEEANIGKRQKLDALKRLQWFLD
ncbi:MAG: DUF763 domain-containing protein [Candidatus Pacearchaeota archaeon]